MKKNFENKVAIITGASSGIGLETALALVSRGARVVLAARSVQALNQLEQQIKESGGQAISIPTDITQETQVKALIQATLDHWGQVDILVSNAGQYIRSPIINLTPEIVEQSMAVNFYGGLYAVLAVLPHMLSQASGHIVLVSSMDAKTPLITDAPYVIAKSALAGFGDVLRQELCGTGVNSTLIFPGRIDTPMISSLKVPFVSAKIPAKTVARAIVRGIERRQACVILPIQTQLLNIINFVSPPLADWAVRIFHLQGWEN